MLIWLLRDSYILEANVLVDVLSDQATSAHTTSTPLV